MTAPLDAHRALGSLFRKLIVDSFRRTFASTANLRAVVSPLRRDDGVWVSVHIHPEHQGVPWPLPPCAVRIAESTVAVEIGASGRVLLGPVADGQYRLQVDPPAIVHATSPELSRRLGTALRRSWYSRWTRAPRLNAADTVQERLAAAAPESHLPRMQPFDEVSDDGSIRIRVLQDDDGRLVIRLATDQLTLHGYAAEVSLASVSGECVLERVADDQLLGEITLPSEGLFENSVEPLSVRVVLRKNRDG